tara:strand:- start:356 stop:898 length:543 start_codon:yes stop_codon:yes gene_type:complete
MATLSDTQALYGLFADATPVSIAGTNKRRIGRTGQRVAFTGADILYRIKVTATAANDQVTINGTTGAVTQNVGTPNVTRWTGNIADLAAKDFEGDAIPTAARHFGMLIEADAANDKYISVSQSQSWAPVFSQIHAGFSCLYVAPPAGYAGSVPSNATLQFENDAAAVGDSFTFTFCGKSS